jgi:hypothetical protein
MVPRQYGAGNERDIRRKSPAFSIYISEVAPILRRDRAMEWRP